MWAKLHRMVLDSAPGAGGPVSLRDRLRQCPLPQRGRLTGPNPTEDLPHRRPPRAVPVDRYLRREPLRKPGPYPPPGPGHTAHPLTSRPPTPTTRQVSQRQGLRAPAPAAVTVLPPHPTPRCPQRRRRSPQSQLRSAIHEMESLGIEELTKTTHSRFRATTGIAPVHTSPPLESSQRPSRPRRLPLPQRPIGHPKRASSPVPLPAGEDIDFVYLSEDTPPSARPSAQTALHTFLQRKYPLPSRFEATPNQQATIGPHLTAEPTTSWPLGAHPPYSASDLRAPFLLK